ncbi:winged helix-turn-helix transcriptional regulator [Paenibacillus sp. HN-1]|uniref:ArsR/SmtB family transcription factor n=1 Tax=Paenibacillus TaxID=44249 RepID=UPI001CA96EB7|nr:MULTISPECIES: metalloregulator ArsR/SmtB family transcription factor [Paenibacillus]MBY9077101.1 winged helix-turn-helix transcriptional regulator [Paenibacillus sp. CGMCC 1.18879]MBY9083399.1 winged helix-turn-helix transcriptional regulator [Paenibacillus sinensis]
MGKQALEIFRESLPVLQVLSDPNRQDILLLLSENGKMTVNEITERLTLSRPAVSHHLKLLKNAGVVGVEQLGTLRYYFLSMQDSVDLLRRLLAALERDCL